MPEKDLISGSLCLFLKSNFSVLSQESRLPTLDCLCQCRECCHDKRDEQELSLSLINIYLALLWHYREDSPWQQGASDLRADTHDDETKKKKKMFKLGYRKFFSDLVLPLALFVQLCPWLPHLPFVIFPKFVFGQSYTYITAWTPGGYTRPEACPPGLPRGVGDKRGLSFLIHPLWAQYKGKHVGFRVLLYHMCVSQGSDFSLFGPQFLICKMGIILASQCGCPG